MKILVYGIGGLGNCLFQLATAIYYKEKYNFDEIILNYNDNLLWGTCYMSDRDKRYKINNVPISYKETIFKKINFIKHQSEFEKHKFIINNYNDDIIELNNNDVNTQEEIIIPVPMVWILLYSWFFIHIFLFCSYSDFIIL